MVNLRPVASVKHPLYAHPADEIWRETRIGEALAVATSKAVKVKTVESMTMRCKRIESVEMRDSGCTGESHFVEGALPLL